MNEDQWEAYGWLATGLSREQLGAELACRGVDVVAAKYVLRLRVDGERIELEPTSEGYLLSRNNDGAGWIAALRRLSELLRGLGVRHRFEFMNGDAIVETHALEGP